MPARDATATTEPAAPPKPARLKLGARIFLLASLLILLAVAAAVAVTWYLADRIAREEIAQRLAGNAAVRQVAEQDRYDRLHLVASLFVADANLQAYVAESVAQDQTASLLDLLAERQEDLGFDFAILLDPLGRVLARTDQLDATGSDLSQRPLVAEALTNYQAAGVWSEGRRLYHAVAIPIAQGFDLLGFFVSAYRIDDLTAQDAQRITGAEIVLFGLGDGELEVIGTTLAVAPASRLAETIRQRPALRADVAAGTPMTWAEVELARGRWLAQIEPLADAAGSPVGAAVSLASLDRELAPFRRIELALILSGLLAVLLAAALTYAMAGRILRPIRRLVTAANAARRGEYDQRIAVERLDEIGHLALTLDHLLGDLREKRDMEAYVAELSRNLPDSAGAGETAPAPAEVVELTLLAAEFRRHAAADTAPGSDAERALDALDADLRRATEVATRRGGRVLGRAGHRLLVAFERGDHARLALGAATEIHRATGAHPPAMALVSGRVAARLLAPDDGRARAVGQPLQRLESLLREAEPEEIVIGDEVHAAIAGTLREQAIVARERRGLLTPLRFHALDRVAIHSLATPSGSTAELSPLLTPLEPGAVVAGRFEILSRLGEGGMGVVYKARDRELDDVVALKLLRLGRFGGDAKVAALKQELKLARRITHPNVLRLFDLGEVEGVPFISMEYVRGLTMRDLLDHSTRVPYSAALRLARQVCRGLDAVHSAGVIHRDMKPENILLEPNGNARLMDFGIAQPLAEAAGAGGTVLGTPRYLAPEQIQGEEIDTRADVYACGVLFYELFTGKLPLPAAANPGEELRTTLTATPTPPREHRPELPQALELILLRCLEKAPKRRYRDAAELLAAFEGLAP